jgi:hypothetical protein
MTRICRVVVVCLAFQGLLHASVINTSNAGEVAAFQSGATVVNFNSIAGRTPETITSYTSGNAIVSTTAFIFNQIAGVQFSVGGMVGTNTPALYSLSGGIAGDAKSPPTVLGPVDFDFTTKFASGAMIEIFFPTKVSRVGFWLNPALGNVTLIALDTNFAFSGLPDTNLEMGTGTAGNFVGIERATADIGGFKILGLGQTGFTIDDFTFGGATTPPTVPESSSLVLLFCGLIVAGLLAASKARTHPEDLALLSK